MVHELEQDAIKLGQLMAENGLARETSFIDDELREAFFRAYDQRKAAMAEQQSPAPAA